MEYVGEKHTQDSLLGNHLFLYLYFPLLKTVFFPHFSYKVFGVLSKLYGSITEYLGCGSLLALALVGVLKFKNHAMAKIQGSCRS